MESLNMSKLNLSSVTSDVPIEKVCKAEKTEGKSDTNLSVSDIDNDYQCEYREDIWKNLLEQESERVPIHLQSPQLEFRGTLVQQLRDITTKLSLTVATLHAAVALLDQFMDAHRLRSDRLTHVASACLSLAAKSEEKFSRAPTLKTLLKVSGIQICGKTFRQLEWMVGQHVRWRLLTPTAATYAALIAQHVVADSDLTTRHPKFVRRFRRDGAKLLDAYLDLTLSDVRLKVVETVDVGCASVACARADLGLRAWPPWLADVTTRDANKVAPIAKLLQRMMQVMKSRESTIANSEVDQGYGSARTTPNLTPSTSPQSHVSPVASYINGEAYRQTSTEETNENPALDLSDTYLPHMDSTDPNDFRYNRSRRLLENEIRQQPTNLAVKRTLGNSLDVDRKRLRLVI